MSNCLSKMLVISIPPKKPKPLMTIQSIMKPPQSSKGCSACSKK